MGDSSNSNLSQELKREGYCVAKGFFSAEQISEINKDFDRVVSDQLKICGFPRSEDLFSNLKALYSHDLKIYLSTIRTFWRSYSILRAFSNNDVLDFVKNLGMQSPSVPTSPVVHILSDELKIPGGYHGQGVHQDWTSMQGSLNSLVIWVALTEITETSFPVDVIPKSHMRGLLRGEPMDDYYKIDPNLYDEADFKPVCAKPGDAIVFSAFLVHRSSVEGQSGFRMATSFRFDDASEESFIKRGYPTAYRRSVERQIIQPDFPTLEMVLKQYK